MFCFLPAFVYVCHVRAYSSRVCSGHKGWKKASGLLELLFKVVVNHHIGVRSWAWILCKSSLGSESLSHLTSSVPFILKEFFQGHLAVVKKGYKGGDV